MNELIFITEYDNFLNKNIVLGNILSKARHLIWTHNGSITLSS